MPASYIKCQIRFLLAVLLVVGSPAFAQSLSFASGAGVPGSVVSLNLSLTTGSTTPAGLQWTLSYPPSVISSVITTAGPALTAAGKTLSCGGSAGSVTCLATGMNTNPIGSGAVAVVTASLAAGTSGTAAIAMSNTMGAGADGTVLSLSGAGGGITVLPVITGLQCLSSSLAAGVSTTCTVSFSGVVPSGGAVVGLSTNNSTALTIPSSVNAAAGATSTTFTATGGTVSTNQSATITGSLNNTSGTVSVTVNAANPVPTITTLSPSTAVAGSAAFNLTVNGTGFVSGAVVKWNGSSRTTTFVSATQLLAAITAADIAAAGTVQVTVFNPTPGGGTSTAATFTVSASNAVPTITTLSPMTAVAGSAAFNLTVNGTGFVSGAVVKWNGSSRTTTFVSATQLQAAITAADIAAAGTVQVTVVNPAPGGGTSTAATFTVSASNAVPAITTLSPTTAVAGSAAFNLTVNGTGFVSGAAVKWNGSSRTTTFVSATQLQAAITAADIAAAGTVQVTVINPAPGGGTSGGVSFAISASNPVPAITTLSPSAAVAGSAAFNLTVNGTGFVSGAVVKWNGSSRTTTFVSATQLLAAITAADIAVAGTVQVTVFNPAPGGGTSGGVSFAISTSNPVPAITTLSPTTAVAGSAAFNLTVNGTGFVSGAVVKWNGSSRTTTFVSATQLLAAITAADIAAAGTVQVTVFNPAPGGGTSGGVSFAISASNPVPAITTLSPTTAVAGSAAFNLTVNGTGFVSGAAVKWNGSSRTTTFVSATQLLAAITAADIAVAGTVQVTVFNPAPGGGTSGGVSFAISTSNPVPAITTLSPTTAVAGSAAFNLTVNGTGFVSGAVVKWNGSSRTTTFVSATQLQTAITAADIAVAGNATVTVFNPTPGGGTSGGVSFAISASNPVPAITTLSPATVVAGSAAFNLTVNGTGFVSGAVVNWNGSSRTTTFVSATQLQTAITAADIAVAGNATVTVFNPTPGGGTSNGSIFTLTTPTGAGTNLALNKPAVQSSTYSSPASIASHAVDGNTDGSYWDNSVTATTFEPNPWWQVDLGAPATVNSVVVWNRTDCCGSWLADYWIFISKTPFLAGDTVATLQGRAGTWNSHQTVAPNPSTTIAVPGVQGQYVRVQLTGTNFLNMAEVQVMGGGGGGSLPGQVTLTSPVNGTTNQAATPTLSWSASGNATAYDLYLGSSNPPSLYAQNVAATSYVVSSTLGAGTTYYWNVVAKNGSGSAVASSTWSFTTATTLPGQVTLTSPVNGVMNQSTTPLLSWSASANATGYDLYLGGSNPPSLYAQNVAATSYVVSTALAAGTTYYWNVVAKNGSGSAVASSTWSFMTATTLPGQVTLTSPVNGAANQSTTPLLSWSASANATGYDLYLGGSNPPSLYAQNVAATSYVVSTALAAGTTYYWNVVAKNGSGSAVASSTWSFMTATGAGTNLALNKPAVQSSTYSSPASIASHAVDGNTDGSYWDNSVTATTFEPNPWWQVDLGAPATVNSVVVWNRTDCCGSWLADYWIFISNTPFLAGDTVATLQGRAGTWNSHQTVAPNPSTTITVPGVQGQYVRVQLTGTNFLNMAEVQVMGGGGGGSLPGQVTLTSPVNGTTNQAATPTLTWTASGNATAYDLYLGSSNPPSLYAQNVAATNYVVSTALGAGTTYYWNVVAKNGSGSAVASSTWSFTTATTLPGQVTLTSPVNGVMNQSTTPLLSWSASANATGYDLYLGGSNPPSLYAQNVAATSYVVSTALAAGTTYYWNVVAKNGSGSAVASSTWSFMTATGAGTNLALNKPAVQSSTYSSPASIASHAVDGNTDGSYWDHSVTATAFEPNPWWQVDLGAPATVNSVVVWNRTDCCGSWLADYWIFISNTPFLAGDTVATLQGRAGTWNSHQTVAPNPSTTITVPGVQGQYVRVQLTGTNFLNMAEVQVIGQ